MSLNGGSHIRTGSGCLVSRQHVFTSTHLCDGMSSDDLVTVYDWPTYSPSDPSILVARKLELSNSVARLCDPCKFIHGIELAWDESSLDFAVLKLSRPIADAESLCDIRQPSLEPGNGCYSLRVSEKEDRF